MRVDIWRDVVTYRGPFGWDVTHPSITVWVWRDGEWQHAGHANSDFEADKLVLDLRRQFD